MGREIKGNPLAQKTSARMRWLFFFVAPRTNVKDAMTFPRKREGHYAARRKIIPLNCKLCIYHVDFIRYFIYKI